MVSSFTRIPPSYFFLLVHRRETERERGPESRESFPFSFTFILVRENHFFNLFLFTLIGSIFPVQVYIHIPYTHIQYNQEESKMLVPPPSDQHSPTNNSSASKLLSFHVNKFCAERVHFRRGSIQRSVREVMKVIQDILKEVELQEPRFISSLNETTNNSSSYASTGTGNGSYFEGVQVHSPTEFEVILYLNQMGVFNFVDDGSIPGAAVLKLSDGRKRSMSLWVEFITASGYLSARKIRSRFQTLVAQVSRMNCVMMKMIPFLSIPSSKACDKSTYRECVKMIPETSEVKLRVRERFIVTITPGKNSSFLPCWFSMRMKTHTHKERESKEYFWKESDTWK